MIAFDLYPRKCSVCGKKFESGVDYVYKHGKPGHKPKWFCSYKCMRKFEKSKERKVG